MGFLFLSLLLFFSVEIKAKTENFFLNTTSSSNTIDGIKSSCNIYSGKWVYDSSYPLYDFSNCPFIDNEFNCQKYKRPDNLYLKYRWQPFSCNLPRLVLLQIYLLIPFLTHFLKKIFLKKNVDFFLQV